MADHYVTWHRTFLPDGPFEGDSPIAQQRPYSLAQKRYKALKFTGSGTVDIYIVSKLNQDFESHATDWEKRFSPLVTKSSAIPVVDEFLTVIGYAGTNGKAFDVYVAGVNGSPQNTISNDCKQEMEFVYQAHLSDLRKLIADDGEVFVDNKYPSGAYFKFQQSLKPVYGYDVLCAVDGRVLQIFNFRSRSGSKAEEAPRDTAMTIVDGIVLAKMPVKLGAKLGSKIILVAIRGVQRKPQQRELCGGDRLTDKPAASDVAQGAAKKVIVLVRSSATSEVGGVKYPPRKAVQ